MLSSFHFHIVDKATNNTLLSGSMNSTDSKKVEAAVKAMAESTKQDVDVSIKEYEYTI